MTETTTTPTTTTMPVEANAAAANRLNFKGENLHVTQRDRAKYVGINFPYNRPGSLDVITERVTFDDAGNLLQTVDGERYSITEPTDAATLASTKPVIGFDGNVIASNIVIKPQMAYGELLNIAKLIVNTIIVNDLMATNKLKR